MKKIILSLSALYLCSTSVFASTAIEDCRTVENDLHRLMCYDAAIDALNKKQVTAAPVAQAKNVAPTTTQAPQVKVAPTNPVQEVVANSATDTEFGLEHKNIGKEADSQELESTISTVKKAPRGELILTLDNGQVWRQLGTDSFRVKAGQTVIISRGAFNSFLLRLEDKNKSIRVKRTS